MINTKISEGGFMERRKILDEVFKKAQFNDMTYLG